MGEEKQANLIFNSISCLYFIGQLKLAKLSVAARENKSFLNALSANLSVKVNAAIDEVGSAVNIDEIIIFHILT